MKDFDKDIAYISSISRYFARLIKNDEYLEYIRASYSEPFCKIDVENILLFDVYDEKSFLRSIRIAKNKILMRLVFCDLKQIIHYEDVVDIYSYFADLVIQKTFAFYAESFNCKKENFYIIAMGKLGGQELNVASDIDLIFAHDNDTSDNQQVLELAKKIIYALENNDENGFVFHVDIRLRPHGSEGKLVPSLNFIEDYYLNYGREWERYAWIKHRVIVGNEDKISNLITPFVYRKYLDYKTISEIRNLKKLIKKDLNEKNKLNDIKLGVGGIREIEFIVQAIQLIRGGKNPHLRVKNTLESLQQIFYEKVLNKDEYSKLKTAYIFLRNTEHRIQYLDNKQTHLIPGGDDLNLLSQSFKLDSEEFVLKLNSFRESINFQFVNFFKTENDHEEEVGQFHDKENKDLVDNLAKSKRWNKLSISNQEKILTLFRLLDEEILINNYKKDQKVFLRVFDLIETISSRSNYIAFFIEYTDCFKSVIRFASYSSWIIDYIKKHPILIDDLLINHGNYEVDYDELHARTLETLIKLKSLDEQLDYLRDFKHKLIFQLAILEIKGEIKLEAVSDELSDIADFFINITIDFLKQKFNNDDLFDSFAIVAYGKYGAKEMSYASDLDIVFLYEDTGYDKSEFINIAKKLSTWFSSYTNAGILYELDLALRPNGNNGLLVSSFDAFEKYQMEQAWLWEHQALSKARCCYGNEALNNKFNKIRHKVLTKPRNIKELKYEIFKMRQKMYIQNNFKADSFDLKNDKGGLIDIEFLVQFFVLMYSNKHENLLLNIGNLALINALENYQLIKRDESMLLKKAYLLYRQEIHKLALNNQTNLSVDSELMDNLPHKVHQCFLFYLS
jgi:glutamate-ammonia-ligase adenylyltransferase